MSVCSEELLTLCVTLMITEKQVFICCLAPAEHTEHMAFWKLNICCSGMLGHAVSLDCAGLWDEVKISSHAVAISFI